jgi:uncharacterized Tic20 family protein
MSKYDDLRSLEDLREKGAISEEEFQYEKARILSQNDNSLWGMSENTFITLMHLSQYAGFIFPGLGFALPLVMWLTNRDNPNVELHGKNVANFMISMIIYFVISGILCIVLVGFVLLGILAILELIFVILAAVKASKGEYWKYPLSITFFS